MFKNKLNNRKVFFNFLSLIIVISLSLRNFRKASEYPVKAEQNTADHLLINEILYNPEGSDYPNEWIEIFNPTESNVDLYGYTIEAGGGKFDEIAVVSEHIEVNTGRYVLICEGDVEGCDYYVGRLGLQNGGSATDGVRIVRANGDIIDTLLYDSPNRNNLVDDRGNIADDHECVPSVQAGHSIGRVTSIDSNISSHDFLRLDSPTPGSRNFLPKLAKNPRISEISYTGDLNDFVEITENDSKNLLAWYISTGNGNKQYLEQLNLGNYHSLNVSLDNAYSCIYLYSPDGTLTDTACYSKILDRFSLCRLSDSQNLSACSRTKDKSNLPYVPNTQNIQDFYPITDSSLESGDSIFGVIPLDNGNYLLVDNTGSLEVVTNPELLLSDFSCYVGLIVRDGGIVSLEYVYQELPCDTIMNNPTTITNSNITDRMYGQATITPITTPNDTTKNKFLYFELDGTTVRINNSYLSNQTFESFNQTIYLFHGAVKTYSRASTTAPKYELIPWEISIQSTTNPSKKSLAQAGQPFLLLVSLLIQWLLTSYFILALFSGILHSSNFTILK